MIKGFVVVVIRNDRNDRGRDYWGCEWSWCKWKEKSGGDLVARAGRIKGRNMMPLLLRSCPKITHKRLIPVFVGSGKFPCLPSFIMSSRVTKRAQKQSLNAKERKIRLLETILARSIEMPVYSPCEARGFTSCRASPEDSSRCAECVRSNLLGCDVAGVSTAQLRKIAT
jgi:hypothetical protein